MMKKERWELIKQRYSLGCWLFADAVRLLPRRVSEDETHNVVVGTQNEIKEKGGHATTNVQHVRTRSQQQRRITVSSL